MLATTLDLTQAVTAVAVITGIVAGIALILKTPRETGQIAVTAAQGAVLVQTGVIESLTEELERIKKDYRELSERFDELARTSADADRLRARVADLENERGRLTLRVGELEAQNLQLREELDIVKEQTNGKSHP